MQRGNDDEGGEGIVVENAVEGDPAYLIKNSFHYYRNLSLLPSQISVVSDTDHLPQTLVIDQNHFAVHGNYKLT